MTDAILRLRGLSKRFGKLEVLHGIDLDVRPQELVFIIGPSGSGKSTLLRCCNRLEEPDAGSVFVDGVDLLARDTDINAVRRRIGMVFQSFNLYPAHDRPGQRHSGVAQSAEKKSRRGRATGAGGARAGWAGR